MEYETNKKDQNNNMSGQVYVWGAGREGRRMSMLVTHGVHGIFSTSYKICTINSDISSTQSYNISPKFSIKYEITRVSCEWVKYDNTNTRRLYQWQEHPYLILSPTIAPTNNHTSVLWRPMPALQPWGNSVLFFYHQERRKYDSQRIWFGSIWQY